MKHTVKTILFIGLALIALFGMTACPNAAGGSTGGNSGGGSGGITIPQINLDEQWVNDTVNKANVTPTVIVGTGKKITFSGEHLKWTSDNTAVINVTNAASGQYTVTPLESKVDVKLTAKAVKGSYSKERVFTVVVSKEAAGLTAAELIKGINLPGETETDLTLPATIAGTDITWESDKPSVIGNDGRITHTERDLRNKDVKLTAKLTYNAQQAEKTFTVALKRLTKIENKYTYGSVTTTSTWVFTDSQITHTRTQTGGSNPYKEGSMYTYNGLNTEAKTFTAHQTHDMFDGTWYEIGSVEHKARLMKFPGITEAGYTAYVNYLKFPKPYEYEITYGSMNPCQPATYRFEAHRTYDNSKKWFEQNGYYSYKEPLPPQNESVKFFYRGTDLVSFYYNYKNYNGSLNPQGTVFTGTEQVEPGQSGSSISVNIEDKMNGTISITVESTPYTLTFKGERLF